jgi:hypothetical protein
MTTLTLPRQPAQGMTRDERRVIFASSLGTVFEWYDFYLYATLAPFFAALFFPPGNDTAALLSAFATYAAGFLVRPRPFSGCRGREAAQFFPRFVPEFPRERNGRHRVVRHGHGEDVFQGVPGTVFETTEHINDVFWHLKSHIDSYIHSAIVAQPQTKECRYVPSFCSQFRIRHRRHGRDL